MTPTKEDAMTAQREYRVARNAIEDRSEDEDIRTGAVDLMADVLHVLDQFGEDPMATMQMAWRHYLDEVTDERMSL